MLQSENNMSRVYVLHYSCNVYRPNAVADGCFEIIFKYASRPSYYYILKSLRFLWTLTSWSINYILVMCINIIKIMYRSSEPIYTCVIFVTPLL